MADFSELIQSIEDQGGDIEFSGPQSESSVREVETALSVHLPHSYREFLMQYGSGGLPGSWLSGINDNKALLEGVGNVVYDTNAARKNFLLERHMVVVLHEHSADTVWCLDTSQYNGKDECPVIFLDVDTNKSTAVSDSFGDFFRLYLLAELDDTVSY